MTQAALLGPEGTYTHQAAEKYFDDLEPIFCSTIREVFDSEVETKLVPIENSLGGGVTDTVDLLKERDVTVTAEVVLPIQHTLISDENSFEDIRTVVSHPQALDQSKEIINEHGWDTREASSTAGAVEEIGKGEAALASEIVTEITEKNILEKSVQDRDANVTRFFVLNGEHDAEEKTSLILEPGEDRPGILHAMLSCLSGQEINLSHIQSRPTKEGLGNYYFYVEAEEAGEKLELAKQCLETYGEVEDLGSFAEVKE